MTLLSRNFVIAIALPFSDIELKSWKSQVTERLRTFLNAHTILSKPFFPCNIDGDLRLISTANRSRLVVEESLNVDQSYSPNRVLICFRPASRIGSPTRPHRSYLSLASSRRSTPKMIISKRIIHSSEHGYSQSPAYRL